MAKHGQHAKGMPKGPHKMPDGKHMPGMPPKKMSGKAGGGKKGR